MAAPNPPAARRRTNSSSSSVAVPSSWEASVVSGAMANRFAISRPQLNLRGDQTTIDRTSDMPGSGRPRIETLWLRRSYAAPGRSDTRQSPGPQGNGIAAPASGLNHKACRTTSFHVSCASALVRFPRSILKVPNSDADWPTGRRVHNPFIAVVALSGSRHWASGPCCCTLGDATAGAPGGTSA